MLSFKCMFRLAMVLIVLAVSFPAYSQVGLNARYQANNATDWKIHNLLTDEVTEVPGNGFAFGIDYWFRLPNKRIEFLPELNYHTTKVNVPSGPDLKTDWYSFFFNTNIYLLNLNSDCNCPTFSKQSDFFAKGFFLQLSPGVSLPRFHTDNFSDGADTQTETGSIHFSIGGALGLDIGISDLITITPVAGLRYYPSVEWSNTFPGTTADGVFTIDDVEGELLQFHAGLRLGVRFRP